MNSLISIIEVVLVIVPVLLVVAFTTLAERKTMASMQRRLGPNIVGYYGLLQAFADALKLLLKEYVFVLGSYCALSWGVWAITSPIAFIVTLLVLLSAKVSKICSSFTTSLLHFLSNKLKLLNKKIKVSTKIDKYNPTILNFFFLLLLFFL